MSIGHATACRLLREHCPPPSTVIDVGAFPGGLTRELRSKGWDVVALDKEPSRGISVGDQFNAGTLQDWRSAAPETTFEEAMRAISVEVRRVDIEHEVWPMASESADAIVLTEVIEHLWVNPLAALCEMNRTLKHGGVLLISTPNFASIRNRLNFLRGRMDRVIEHPAMACLKKLKLGHLGHIRLYAPHELRSTLQIVGFSSQFYFYSFEYWDEVPAPPAASSATSAPSNRPARRQGRRWLRSPHEYGAAAIATTRVLLERRFQEWRPHMFVVARKSRSVAVSEIGFDDVRRLSRA